MKNKFEEKPDYIIYEDDSDIIEVRPTGWEMVIKEKDADEDSEYVEEYETREEARAAMMKEIQKIDIENGNEE